MHGGAHLARVPVTRGGARTRPAGIREVLRGPLLDRRHLLGFGAGGGGDVDASLCPAHAGTGGGRPGGDGHGDVRRVRQGQPLGPLRRRAAGPAGLERGRVCSWGSSPTGTRACPRSAWSSNWLLIYTLSYLPRAWDASSPNPPSSAWPCSGRGWGRSSAVHVGDHYYADVLGARSVGLTPVLIDRAGRAEKAGSFDCLVIQLARGTPRPPPKLGSGPRFTKREEAAAASASHCKFGVRPQI